MNGREEFLFQPCQPPACTAHHPKCGSSFLSVVPSLLNTALSNPQLTTSMLQMASPLRTDCCSSYSCCAGHPSPTLAAVLV